MINAVRNGDIEEVKRLLEEGADINIEEDNNDKDNTLLMIAAVNSNGTSSIEMVKFLLEKGADVNKKNKNGQTALIFVVCKTKTTSSLATVELLLDNGADVNIQDNDKWTALRVAASYSISNSTIETVKLLLDRGADINLSTPLITTVIHSNSKSSLKTVELLLDRGANINIKNNKGETALIKSVKYFKSTFSLKTIKFLLDKGANVNILDNEGFSVLMYAVKYSEENKIYFELIKLLLERGADPFHYIYCSVERDLKLISKYRWERLYNRDKDTARRYARQSTLPKDVWEIILLNKRQQQLSLYNLNHREILILFAEEFGISVYPAMSSGKIYASLSRQLAYGKTDKISAEKDLIKYKKNIKIIAKKLNVDTDQPIDCILKILSNIL